MSDPLQPGSPRPKISRVEVYWTTVTYKTVVVYVLLGLAIVLSAVFLVNPSLYDTLERKIANAMGGDVPTAGPLKQNQARFVNLDGKVQVKKANSVVWVPADYRTTLDKGDLVETGADGAARLTFVDGTTYTVKSDTLVTVEENSVGNEGATRVGMKISSGAVDLTTGTFPSSDSRVEVSFADARASVRPNTRADVRSDPTTNEHAITVAAGGAELQRGSEKVEIGRGEKVSVTTGGPVVKSNVLMPPDLLQPLNLQPLIVPDPKHAAIMFEWKPVPDAVAYQLRLSTTSMFSKLVADRRVADTSIELTGLEAGDYFWNITAIDPRKGSSEPSDTYRFSLVAQGKGQDMVLEIEGTQLHGNVAEIMGRTEPGAALLSNGQQVPNIQPDGHFRHFTEPLDRGSHTIVITGQNRRGGTSTKSVTIVVP